METIKKEIAIRRLHLALKKRFQGQTINMGWAEMEGFLKAVEKIELTNIHNAYNDGYQDAESRSSNKTKGGEQ